jgi:multidrug efflux pump subunit AcrA (membrane-fusion protein)
VTRIVLPSVGGAAVLVALTLGVEGCTRSEAAEVPVAAPVVTLVTEDIATVERRDLAMGAIISGTLTARRHATVRAEVGGSVTAIYADRGTEVAAGAPLLRIEGRVMRDAQVAAASDVRTDEEALQLAKRRLTRSASLLAGGAISADEVDDARQTMTSAEARLAASLYRRLPEEARRTETGAVELAMAGALLGLGRTAEARTRATTAHDACTAAFGSHHYRTTEARELLDRIDNA